MAFIKEKIINEIRNEANIIDIISNYLPLTLKGKNYFGVCPFHDDHSPSMSVSLEKQIYKCFSCGATGNVFTFVKEYENVSFMESVKIVADKIGYNFEYKKQIAPDTNQALYDIMNIAMLYFQNNLNTKAGLEAKKYLTDRKIAEESQKLFNLGYALKDVRGLTDLLIKKGYIPKQLEALGLINIKDLNFSDTFINRVIFPLHNLAGQVVGFTGRIFNKENLPKYFNSRESVIFKKGNTLFNYHRALDTIKIKREVIIVEGNMDVIRLASSGIKNVIALMGTALTKEQLEILKKLRAKIILMLDNDEAGETATYQIGQALIKANLNVEVVRLSDYKDPDEYIINKGYQALEACLKNSLSFLNFKMFYLKQNKNLEKTDDLIKYLKELLASLKDADSLTQEITLKKLSEDYNIDYETLKKELSVKKEKEPNKLKLKNKLNNKYEKICERIIFYLINDSMYISLYKRNDIFINSNKHRNLVNEIIYYYTKNKTINVADFISYISQNSDLNTVCLEIINEVEEELKEDNFKIYLKNLENLNKKGKIEKIKKEMNEVLDINKKVELANQLVKLKKEVE